MKNREMLIRLHRFQVDEKRRQVGELESMIDEFRRKERDLEAQVQAEQVKAGISDIGHFAYPMFAKSVLSRRENILHSIKEIDLQLEVAREELAGSYRELKKYEVLEEGRQRRARETVAAREQREQDDIGLAMHRRSSEVETGQ